MTEFWKSGARHWCTYCKLFINGTKPSIAYHENGKKHTEIKELYLKEMRVKARERGKGKKELEGELAKIERAALKQYQRDDAPSSSDARRPPFESGDRASRLAALEAQQDGQRFLAPCSPCGLQARLLAQGHALDARVELSPLGSRSEAAAALWCLPQVADSATLDHPGADRGFQATAVWRRAGWAALGLADAVQPGRRRVLRAHTDGRDAVGASGRRGGGRGAGLRGGRAAGHTPP